MRPTELEFRFLNDLHLNSITISQLMFEAATQLSLPAPVVPGEFTNASIAEAAEVLDGLRSQTRDRTVEKHPRADTRESLVDDEEALDDLVLAPLVRRPKLGLPRPAQHRSNKALPVIVSPIGGRYALENRRKHDRSLASSAHHGRTECHTRFVFRWW